MGKAYTGIDIGDSSIKLVVCEGDAIKNMVIETLPEGLIADGHIVSRDAMADFIKSLVKRTGGIAKNAAFVLPPADCLVRRLTLPAMTEKELNLNLPYEFRDYIAQGKDRYQYDYAVLAMHEDADGTPESMDLLAVACPKQTIDDYLDLFRRAGMHLRVALPEQAALQNLIGGNPNALANCCVIDFTHLSTKLHFFVNGTYDVVRTIEIGGSDIDRAIAQDRGVDEHIASNYKLSNFEGAQRSAAAMSVYDSIAVEIGRAINFYGFNNPDITIEAAYCCGGGSLLEPLMETVESHVELELRSIADVMAPVQGANDFRVLCASAVGATRGAR